MLNRAALILRYKQPFIDWINSADPTPGAQVFTLAEVNQQHTGYLLLEVEDERELGRWLSRHRKELFEDELGAGIPIPSCGPRTGR